MKNQQHIIDLRSISITWLCWIVFLGMGLFGGQSWAGALDDGRDGELARQSGNCEKAIQLFTRALDEGLPRKNMLAAHVLRGYCFEAEGLLDKAIADFDIALLANPDNLEAHIGRGNTRLLKSQYDQAVEDYDEVLRLNPRFTDAYIDRGIAYKNKELYGKANKDFCEAIKLDPKNAKALHNRGELYIRMNLYDRALADYDEIVRMYPNDPDGFNGRGRVQFLLGKFRAAADDFESAWRASPNSQYNPIWQYLSNARMKVDGRDKLRQATVNNASGDWPFPVVEFFLGGSTREKLLKAASDPDTRKQDGKRCEVYAFLGELEIAKGSKIYAQQLFWQARKVCPKGFVESGLVDAELRNFNRKS